MTEWDQLPEKVGEPSFDNLLTVLRREKPSRPTLFEFFLNDRLYQRLAPQSVAERLEQYSRQKQVMRAYLRAGYDFTNVLIPSFEFPFKRVEETRRSLTTFGWRQSHDGSDLFDL
jgi:uroporphyrinogen decarboxylase